jgi:hypothetical protein
MLSGAMSASISSRTPEAFGKWFTVYKRSGAGRRRRLGARFKALGDDPDFEYALIDGTLVHVQEHGTGKKRGIQNQADGRSRGALTTKIMALVDALGNLIRLVLFAVHWLRAVLNERGAAALRSQCAGRGRANISAGEPDGAAHLGQFRQKSLNWIGASGL